jgi:hypothetical protein
MKLLSAMAMLAIMATVASAADKTGTRVTVNGFTINRTILGQAPVKVVLVGRIDHPTEDWNCPEFVVEWAPMLTSKRLSDCDPDEPADYFVSERIVGFLGQGRHDILVTLQQGKKRMVFHLVAEIL